MNTHELPMIIFTVLGQMSVGTFIVLGVMQLIAGMRYDVKTVERLTEPVVYAIGPALVLGLAASTLHMNDVMNTLNVFRNVGSSWLSREIVFGLTFAALGFIFALMEWFKVGSFRIRQVVAALTALAGLGLVWAMSQIYASLETVPAWNTWIVPFHFFATSIILGALATGLALLLTAQIRKNAEVKAAAQHAEPVTQSSDEGGSVMTAVRARVQQVNQPTTAKEWALTTNTVAVLAVVTAVTGALVLISYPIHIGNLSTDAVGVVSAQVFSGAFFIARLVLTGLVSAVLAVFTYRTASQTVQDNPRLLTALMTAAFVLAFTAELMGRSLHYDSMLRIGM